MGTVGAGSSGTVHRVRDKRNGMLLVLKVIPFDVQSDTIRKQVMNELRTLYGASHPHIVRYHQSYFANGSITIAMEYMDGGSLLDATRHCRRLAEPYVAEVARQVLQGLSYLHGELHVVHRDIKPSNLLLNSAGQLKISDFGVSGHLANSVSQCVSWVGTVTYMSPERIKGDAYSYDSDVWSLGLVLMEVALGRFPYSAAPSDGSTPLPLGFWELLDFIVSEPVPQLPAEQFSEHFRSFVAACLAKEPGQRPKLSDLLAHPFLALHPPACLADLLQHH